MTIIVTGGAGFIGGNFVYYELEKHPEDRVVCLDSLTYAGNLATLEEAMKNDVHLSRGTSPTVRRWKPSLRRKSRTSW